MFTHTYKQNSKHHEQTSNALQEQEQLNAAPTAVHVAFG